MDIYTNETRKILKDLLDEYIKLEKQLIKSIKAAPAGSLKVSSSHGCPQYLSKKSKINPTDNYKYIRKSEIEIARGIAQREYDEKLLAEVQRCKNIAYKAIKMTHPNEKWNSCKGLNDGRKRLINQHYLSDDEYIRMWMEEDYVKKEFFEDDTEIYTNNGERVRSKSEKIIADYLLYHRIPYKYERQLCLEDGTVMYPDFTILNVNNRKEYYLEHFGMMESPQYARSFTLKMNTYIRNGILPGEKLISTYEGSSVVLDYRVLNILFEAFMR